MLSDERIRQIADDIYCSEGTHAEIEHSIRAALAEAAIAANEEADKLAMTCLNLQYARRLDQLVCDADNLSRDFVRRHGREMIAEITLLLNTLADVVDHDFAYVGGEACVDDPRSLYNRVKRAREVLAGTRHDLQS